MRGRAPANRNSALSFDALHLAALREGGRMEEALETGNERGVLILAPAHVQPARAALCCWNKARSPLPVAPRTGLMAPACRPALCIRGVALDLARQPCLPFEVAWRASPPRAPHGDLTLSTMRPLFRFAAAFPSPLFPAPRSLLFSVTTYPSQVMNYSPNTWRRTPSRSHQASSQSGLGVG